LLGVAGTRGYMAPEVAAGQAATPASDQYSFCATLLEALGGRAPLSGAGLQLGNVPRQVRQVLRRGLSTRPEARFPSMEALLSRLGPERRVVVVASCGGGRAGSRGALRSRVGMATPRPGPAVRR